MRRLPTASGANSSRARLCDATWNKKAMSSNLRALPTLNGLLTARRSISAVFSDGRSDRNEIGMARKPGVPKGTARRISAIALAVSQPLFENQATRIWRIASCSLDSHRLKVANDMNLTAWISFADRPWQSIGEENIAQMRMLPRIRSNPLPLVPNCVSASFDGMSTCELDGKVLYLLVSG